MNRSPSRNLRGARGLEIGRCLAEALETRWRSYREELRRCQKDFSEEGVHELRVAARRLMAQLVLLSCVVRSAPIEKARRILKRRSAALGELRDTHVQLAAVAGQTAHFPELTVIRDWLQRRERRLGKSAAKQVRGFKTRKLQKWLRAITQDLRGQSRGPRDQRRLTAAVLRITARAFADVVKRRQGIDLADLRTIHQIRVAFKKFRYMVESLSPDLTGLSKRQLRALAYYQRKMGIIQDLEVLEACVARFIREHQEAEASLGLFGRYLRQRRARALRSFLRSADRLFEFWPPVKLATVSDLAVTRSAA